WPARWCRAPQSPKHRSSTQDSTVQAKLSRYGHGDGTSGVVCVGVVSVSTVCLMHAPSSTSVVRTAEAYALKPARMNVVVCWKTIAPPRYLPRLEFVGDLKWASLLNARGG
ncbi:unnamed protein product, partial [Scytosiphon promiscuus]